MIQQTTVNAGWFRMTAAPAQLREDNRYQQMRSEINRRQSPFSGGTDWEKVYDLAATLAMTDGVDLLAASYFSVAAAKTRGIAGLASGLELLLTVLAHSKEMGTISPEKCAEILNWAIGKLLPELKDMQATEGNIREWYRCEYACQQLFELMQARQPKQMPNLDALGFQIFDKIDGVKQPAKRPAVATSAQQQSNSKGLSWPLGLILLLLALTAGHFAEPLGLTIGQKFWPELFAPKPPEQVTQLPTETALPLWQKIDQLFGAAPLANDEPYVYPEQVDYLLELDKYFQRFAASRTRAANLSKELQQWQGLDANKLSALQRQSRDMAEYASSLSPVLARAYFIDELLKQQQNERAAQELTLLDRQLKSLLIKRTLLAQSLGLTQASGVTNDPAVQTAPDSDKAPMAAGSDRTNVQDAADVQDVVM
ncbi:type VI secretion system ImpA family N-terminal domain-containing protein [Shewanella algae]|uniref:type VI secretion system ImpA family N-terminal domain-containing protein n=1 Tax=Shewanella algae TaxID=38313 RepID=UPI001AAF44D4|nr:type VI secretion system ImpA family N-terminal domain-containing protein [Shewanella algae]MBO2589777.1 type VI secretion system ImpA family N-terminal domain-containing protein [Shewanella algae]